MIKVIIIDTKYNKVLDDTSYEDDVEFDKDLNNLMSKLIKTNMKVGNILEANLVLSLVNKKLIKLDDEGSLNTPTEKDEILLVVSGKCLYTDSSIDKEAIEFIGSTARMSPKLLTEIVATYSLKYEDRLDKFLSSTNLDNVKYFYV